jgi:hypothetical protein
VLESRLGASRAKMLDTVHGEQQTTAPKSGARRT